MKCDPFTWKVDVKASFKTLYFFPFCYIFIQITHILRNLYVCQADTY